MKTTKKLSNPLAANITKSYSLESYKGQQYIDALDIWGSREYAFIGTNGKVNTCKCIVVMRHEMDKQPLTGYNSIYGDETYTPQNTKSNNIMKTLSAFALLSAIAMIVAFVIYVVNNPSIIETLKH